MLKPGYGRVNLTFKTRFAAYLGKYNSNGKQRLRLNVNMLSGFALNGYQLNSK